MLTLYPTIYNISFDTDRLFLQCLLAIFALSFIYIACRSMRIVEKQYGKTSKKIKKLRGRMAIVLAQHEPLCQEILYHNVIRHRKSLVAGYLKDLINEKKLEHERFSNFFKDFPKTLLNKRTLSCSTGSSEKFDPILKLNSKNVSEDSSPDENGYDEQFSLQKKNITQNKRHGEAKDGRKSEMKVVKSPLESKIFKSIEGQNKRLRSSFSERRKSKLPKWNMNGFKNAHDRFNENLTVYTALTSTRSPFKSYSKSKEQRVQKGNLALKSSYAKQHSNSLNVNRLTKIEEYNVDQRESGNQETHVPKYNSTEEATNINKDICMGSVGSSGFESDNEFEPFDDKNIRQPLTTINEESAEENSLSE